MRPVSIFIFLLLANWTLAQTEEERYYAWLDSMKSDKYTMSNVVQLDEIVVVDSLNRAFLNDPKNKINLRNTDQMMHSIGGIHMVRRGNFASEPMMRGLTSERYVISIDGMRIFSACTDKMDPVSSYVEPINMRTLQTTFGSQTNMTGSSTGGSINFGLKKPVFNKDNPLRSTLNLGYSSVSGGFDQSLDVNYSKSKVAFRLSGVHRKAHNYQDGEGNEVRYSQYEKFNYASSISYRLTPSHLLTLDFLADDAIDVGYPALPMDVSSARARMFGLTLLAPSIGFIQDPEIKVYHNYIKHQMDDTKREFVPMHMDMPGETRTSGAYIKGWILDNKSQSLEVKADAFHNYSHAEMTMYPNESGQLPMFMLTWPDINRMVSGLEFRHNLNLSDKLSLASSLRIENASTHITSDFGERQLSVFDKSGTNSRIEWLKNASVGLIRSYKAHTSKVSISYGERLPSVSEQFGFYLFNRQDGYDYIGDPDIEKEQNIHFEVSHGVATEKSKLTITGFTYLFSDYIMGIYDPQLSVMTIGARGVKWYQNVSSARMHGGELEFQTLLSGALTVRGDVKYVYGVDFEGDPLPQQPPFKGNFSVAKRLKGWMIQPEIEYGAEQLRISEKFNEVTTDQFTLLNIRFSKNLEGKRVTYILSGGVENATNVAYREHFDIGNILRPGRNFYLQTTFKF